MIKWAIGGGFVLAVILVILMFLPKSQTDFVQSDSSLVNKSSQEKTNLNDKEETSSKTSQELPSDPEDPWKGYDKKKAREVLKDEGLPMGATSYSGPRPLSEEEMDQMDKTFEAYEKGWDKSMRSLMQESLGLSEEDYGDYLKMRDGYEEDRLEAFESFHERMAQERGPHYSYSPTQEMIDFDNKLRQEYKDLFRNRYGEEAYARYIDALEKYNDKIRKEADPSYGVITIEF